MMRRRVGEAPRAERSKVELARALRRAMTPAERCLWHGLRRASLGVRARPQHVIRGWIVDFYVAPWRLVIEVDGDIRDLQRDEDARRTEALCAEGLAMMRVRNDEVLADLPGVLQRIRSAMTSR